MNLVSKELSSNTQTRKVLFEKIYQDIDLYKVQQKIFKELICRKLKWRFRIISVKSGIAYYKIDYFVYRRQANEGNRSIRLNHSYAGSIKVRELSKRSRSIHKLIIHDINDYHISEIAKRI